MKVHPVSPQFSLGMDSESFFLIKTNLITWARPSSKKIKSLRTKGKENYLINDVTRFEEAFSTASEAQYEQLAKGFTPRKRLRSVLSGHYKPLQSMVQTTERLISRPRPVP